MQNGGLSSILNNYNFLSGGGVSGAGVSSNPGSSLLKSNNPYQPLNRSQISSLWNNGPAAGLLGSIPRGPYGNFTGSQVMTKFHIKLNLFCNRGDIFQCQGGSRFENSSTL